ncbi:MAG: ATP-binding protein, partial [Kangiellaceae bacterium]
NEMTMYDEDKGFPSVRSFASILSDKDHNIWVSSGQNIHKFDTQSLVTKTYYTSDGLQDGVFARRTETKTTSGELFFGGSNGFNRFKPKNLAKNMSIPKIAFTKFYYLGEEYSHDNEPEDFRLPSPISQLKHLNLTHKDYNFGIEFSALHFSDYSRNHYAYMMDGFDPDWLYTDSSNRKVNYTNLPAGNYIFKVKASNKDGIWNETPKELKITISPAPWKTWWAYTIYTITLFLSLLYFIKKRTQILEERAQQLENTVEQRTQELSQEKQKVERLLSKKNEEFANVSHEFRTPLTLVLGPVAQLIEKANDEASINKLNIIQRNGYRLLRMVDQLLNIETFRIKTIAKKSPQAIGKSTKLMCEAFADLADAKGMKLSFSGEESINFEFTQDAYEKILLNLLSNAIKYSKTGAQISVTALRTGNNEYHLSVSDTGIGIPADKVDSVFERYNRVMDENSEQVTGAGIGLALVKELVKAHQGRIKLQSQIGEGTCIDIYLPIINEVSDEQVATSSNADLIDLELVSLSNQKAGDANRSETEDESVVKESTVLVIEDNADMRQYITNSLQGQYRVLTANNGKAGVELAIAEVPDVIVSDIMMPVMDGYEATKAIRDNEITSHIPLVLLTARGDRESRLRGWNEKADEYLTKPFDVEELRIRLANLLEIRNLLKKKFAETIFVEDTALETPKEVEDQTDIYSNKQKLQQIFIDKLNSFLNDHYSDTELAIPQISKGILMSERQFFRKLKSILDLSPVEYLRRYRLQKGKELLGQGLSTNRAAFDVGFSSQGYFGRCFKAQYGVSPSEYKKQLQSKA